MLAEIHFLRLEAQLRVAQEGYFRGGP
jgi:hypothetical protein